MNLYEVLIDTNIYDASNYSFGSPQYCKLVELSSIGYVKILINSIVEGEVLRHISVRVKDAVKNINEALNDRVITPFRHEENYKELVKLFDYKEMTTLLETRFSEFLHQCGFLRISSNGIDAERIVQDYFAQNPPFEAQKPDEFKDAIIIQSLIEYKKHSKDSVICAITNDKGFKKALVTTGIVQYDDISSFLDYITVLIDKQAACLKLYISEGYIDEEVEEQIRSAIEEISFSFEEIPDEFNISDVSDISFELLYVDSLNAQTADIVIEANAIIKVWSSTVDEEQSYFDKEDWKYLWKVEIEKEETHSITFEMLITLDISNFADHTADEGVPDFANDEIIATGYSDAPADFLLDDESCIEVEILSETDPYIQNDDGSKESCYTYCPDCGSPIGTDNDGGNGFCIKCAWDH